MKTTRVKETYEDYLERVERAMLHYKLKQQEFRSARTKKHQDDKAEPST